MIIDAVFKEEEGMKAEFGEVNIVGNGGGGVSLEYVNQTFANVLKGKVSGNPIRIDDSSPIPHELKVEGVGVALVSEREGINGNPIAYEKYTITAISSEATGESVNSLSAGEDGYAELDDGVAGVGGVFAVGIAVGDSVFYNGTTFLKGGGTVTKYGKNLFDPASERYKAFMRDEGGNDYRLNGSDDSHSFIIPCLPNTAYTFSHYNTANNIFRVAYVTVPKEEIPNGSGTGSISCYALIAYGSAYAREITITTGEGATFLVVQFGASQSSNTVKVAQCEVGKFATDFEEYKEPTTYTADENGNVQGITASGETMTLVAESGTTITAEYNKDTNKAFESLVNAIISLGGKV